MTRASRRLGHDARAFAMALAGGLPGAAVAMWLTWRGGFAPKIEWTVTLLVVGTWLGFAIRVREHVVRPLHTISNLLAALREGDFSIRGRCPNIDDALGLAMTEINALGGTLREQRLGALEANTLLTQVMAEVDVAIFAFDHEKRLRLVNRAGERVLGQPADRARGRSVDELGMAQLLEGEAPRRIDVEFTHQTGLWELRRRSFRRGGVPHELVVLCDLERALREQERQAWQRLVRVLGHEINNSLAPIRSLAGNLQSILTSKPEDWDDDMARGLAVIERRADALNRFMSAYARLARLPPPQPKPVDVETWVRRVVELEKRLAVDVVAGPAVVLEADGDQLDQALINVVRNAVEAALETGGSVRVAWTATAASVDVHIVDEGPGIADSGNLFVPFFTTKPGGSGIGLVLSRQIAEAHRGKLVLCNNPSGRGCTARLTLPR